MALLTLDTNLLEDTAETYPSFEFDSVSCYGNGICGECLEKTDVIKFTSGRTICSDCINITVKDMLYTCNFIWEAGIPFYNEKWW